MPELAEVEYFRKQWDCGIGNRIVSVKLHSRKRVFRGTDVQRLRRVLRDSILLASEARGKQMLFQFSGGLWLGIHLGMTGRLSAASPEFEPGKHDHLVLYQKDAALVFSDIRLFGRILFHEGITPPEWWLNLPTELSSKSFTNAVMQRFLKRHAKLPIKAALLLQSGFPGVGNWMADEILWRSRIHPRTASGELQVEQLRKLWREIRHVCRASLKKVGADFSDPPSGWLFHERWKEGGVCPLHGVYLAKERISGRTSAFCPKCQVYWIKTDDSCFPGAQV